MASKFQIFCDDDMTDESNQAPATTKSRALQPLAFGKLCEIKPLAQHPNNDKSTAVESNLHTNQLQPFSKISVRPRQGLQPQQSQSQPLLPNEQPTSRQLSHQLSSQQLPSLSSYTGAAITDVDDDQENDISMASLGSEYDPSFVYSGRRDRSANDGSRDLLSDEEENDENFIEGGAVTSVDDQYYIENFEESFRSNEQLEDSLAESEGDEYDDDLLMELDSAFKEHDSNVCYKSIDYVEDIMDYLFKLERNDELRPAVNYMDAQPEIDSKKRRILVDWLVDVNDDLKMQPETLFMTINIIDRFLSKMEVRLEDLQLLAVAAMFSASKYEEIYPPELHRFVEHTENTYSATQIREMEQRVLIALDFRLSMPSSLYFMQEIFTFNKFTKQVYHLAQFLCYLSLHEDQPFIAYYPSEIAYSSVILAAIELNASNKITPEIQENFDKSNIDQLHRFDNFKTIPPCIHSLLHIQRNSVSYEAVFEMFSLPQYESVACIKPCSIKTLNEVIGN